MSTSLISALSDTQINRGVTVRDQVIEILRNAILSNELAPGTQLIERELCESLSASRTTVREAIRRLEAEGLISSNEQRRSYVSTISIDEAADLYELRDALECRAVVLFCERASESEISELSDLADRLAQAKDTDALSEVKSRIYDLLYRGTRNGELIKHLDLVSGRLQLMKRSSLAAPGRPEQSKREISDLVQAVSHRDAKEAERLCRNHIRAAFGALREQFEA